MVIKTLPDIGLYKFITSYAYIKLFLCTMGTFSSNNRSETQHTEDFLEALEAEIRNPSQLRFMEKELEYMTKSYRFLPRVYWEWLSSFHFDPNKIDVHLNGACHLHVKVADLLYKMTLYEVPLLVIISKTESRFLGNVTDMNEILCRLLEKIELSSQHQLRFSEFGIRGRFSIDAQRTVIRKLNEAAQYRTGTSNCNFAMKYGVKMMGTHPYEWLMFHGVQFGHKHANYMTLENWVNVYDGGLGIVFSDTYTSSIFLNNLSRKQVKLFSGVRCDSGNRFESIDKLVARHEELRVDTTTKTIVFSNAPGSTKALDIQEYCKNKTRCSFGVGTDLINDTGFEPSNTVMRLTRCKMNVNQEQRECIKLSDDEGKHTGSLEEVQACLYGLRLNGKQ